MTARDKSILILAVGSIALGVVGKNVPLAGLGATVAAIILLSQIPTESVVE
ncbi:MAG: hypothetical protein ACYTAN_10300 [Planctomycetota bacterium]